MSYILDALKKSEQERRRGSTPDLQTVQHPINLKPKKKPLWPYLVLAALVINAGLFAWWLRPWQSVAPVESNRSPVFEQLAAATPEDTPRAQPDATMNEMHTIPKTSPQRSEDRPAPLENEKKLASGEQVAAAVKGELSPDRSDQLSGDTLPPPAQTEEPTAAAGPVADMPEKQAPATILDEPRGRLVKPPPASSMQKAESPSAASSTSPSIQQPSPESMSNALAGNRQDEAQSAALQDKETAPGENPNEILQELQAELAKLEKSKTVEYKSSPPVPPAAVPAPAFQELPAENHTSASPKAASGTGEPLTQNVPDFFDLPPTIRKNIPRIKFSFLAYSKNPSERMASINGTMMHEGQELGAGLKLEEITPDGAIFSYEGHRFRKGMF